MKFFRLYLEISKLIIDLKEETSVKHFTNRK